MGKVLTIPELNINIVFIFRRSLTRQNVRVKREVKLSWGSVSFGDTWDKVINPKRQRCCHEGNLVTLVFIYLDPTKPWEEQILGNIDNLLKISNADY